MAKGAMTKDSNKTKERLIAELEDARRRVAELEAEESGSGKEDLAHLRFLENLGRIDYAIRQADDLEQMLNDVIETVLGSFGCDRAWLLYPCDPKAPSWRVPIERTRAERPGALAVGADLPMTPDIIQVMQAALDVDGPVLCGPHPGYDPLPASVEPFEVRSQILIALYPKVGKPWAFGMHQCSHARLWTDDEQRLFQEIARRVADGLSSLLSLRELRKSEEWFRALVETTNHWIWEVDASGAYTYVSPRVKELLGYKPEEVLGKTPFDLMPPGEAERLAGIFKGAVQRREPIVGLENVNLHRDGRLVVLETNGVPMLDEHGGLVGYRGVDRDITERKRAEDDLRRLRNLLSNIVNSMPSVLVGVDEEGRVTQWNREAEKASGVSENEAQGHTLSEVFPQLAAEMQKVRQAIRDREPIRDAKVASKTDAGTRYTDVTVYPLVTNGVEGAVIRVDDVTERVRIEEMMIQSEKMLSVGGLAAGMAHEVNNPLAGILQNVQVLRNRISGALPRNARTAEACGTTMEAIEAYAKERGLLLMIQDIVDSAQRAARIVENMLSFSRRSESRFVPHDLADLLDRTVDLASNDYDLKKKYDFRAVKIVREYDSGVPKVRCEATQIRQVLFNLLKNGAEAMAGWTADNAGMNDRGMEARLVLRLALDGDMVRIEVEDNGPGMNEAIRRRVFEPFFTTKDAGTGTGLGLSVAYFIITENHRGTMAVESSVGHGSKFVVRIPVS